jgi:hypothetical protein
MWSPGCIHLFRCALRGLGLRGLGTQFLRLFLLAYGYGRLNMENINHQADLLCVVDLACKVEYRRLLGK